MTKPDAPKIISANQSVTGAGQPGQAGRLPSAPFSNSKPLSARPRRRLVPPGMIPRGPYARLPRRPEPNRQRYLSLAQVGNLTNALAFADRLGLSLSVGLTVAWDLMPGFQPGDWSARQTALVKAMSEWLQRRGIKPAYVWTREVSASQWHHTHFQIHIPRSGTMRLAKELVADLKRRFGFPDEGVVASLGDWGMWTPAMRAGNFIYLLKGINHRDFRYLSPDETQNIGAELGIKHRGTQGDVSIKRAGTSANLGKAARSAAGWIERRSLVELRAILLPAETPKTKGVLWGHRGLMPVYLPPRSLPEAAPQGPPQRRDRLRVIETR